MAEVGSAFVSILPSAKGFGKNLTKQVEPDTKKAGANIGKSLVKGLAVAGGGAAAFGFLKSAVGDASDLSESASKVGVVFGKQAGQIMQASKSSATAMGLTKSAYLDATGTLGNLLVSLDIAPKKSAAMSQQMVKLAGDLASFNNTSPEEALDALKSGLTGETEPLKRFGVNMNDATLKAQALKMGLIKSTKDALTPQNKALAAQALIMDQTKTAQGDFARTSGGLANQQRILSAQFGNVKATIGGALLPVITSLATTVNTKILPAIKTFIGQMKSGEGAGGTFAAILTRVGAAVGTVFGFLQAHRATITTFVAVLLTIVGAIRIWIGVQAALNFVLTANPIGIVVVAIAALVTGLIIAYKRSETFRDIVNGAFNAVVATGRFLWHALVGYFRLVANVWLTIAGVIIKGAAKAFGWIPGIGPKIRKLAAGFDEFKAQVNRSLNAIDTGHAVAEVNNLRSALDKVKDKEVTVTTMFVNKGKPAGGGASGLPGQAAGTNFWRGGPTWVGERGPEIVNLPRGSQVIPNHKIGGAGGGQYALTITNWKTGAGYMEQIAEGSVISHAGVRNEAVRSKQRRR